MLLNQIWSGSKPPPWRYRHENLGKVAASAGRERELGLDRFLGRLMGVWATGAAGLGAGTESLVDDGLDGPRAAAALGTAAKAAIKLFRIARQRSAGAHGTTDIMVAEDVAGTDDHRKGGSGR